MGAKYMIREFKKQARMILFKNYKLFILPVLLCLFSNFAAVNLFRIAFTQPNSLFKYLCFGLWLLFPLIFSPVSTFLLFKVSAQLANGYEGKDKSLFSDVSFRDVVKICLIWITPNLLNTVNSLFDGLIGYCVLPEHITISISFFSLIFVTILFYFAYKYFACDYYYALNRGTAKETIDFSFKLMKNKFLKYILITLSFIAWYILSAILISVFSKLFDMSDFYMSLLKTTWCGIYFYIKPYECITYSLFIKNNCTPKHK
jgi:uncharacterized membrane protein